MTDLVIIERHKLRLATRAGYFKRFFQLCKETKTYRHAYEQTEKEYREIFRGRKYSSYASFRRGKSTYLKTQKFHKKTTKK